jgi:phage head maturation protease
VNTLDLCTRVEARLWETSVVPVPLFPSAEIMLVATRESTGRPRRAGREYPQLESWRKWRSSI